MQKIQQASDCIFNAKKQKSKQKHKQTIAQDRYDIILQNAKISNRKKCNTHFVITERKKNIKTHEKKPKPNIYALNMTNTNGSIKNLRKSE